MSTLVRTEARSADRRRRRPAGVTSAARNQSCPGYHCHRRRQAAMTMVVRATDEHLGSNRGAQRRQTPQAPRRGDERSEESILSGVPLSSAPTGGDDNGSPGYG